MPKLRMEHEHNQSVELCRLAVLRTIRINVQFIYYLGFHNFDLDLEALLFPSRSGNST